MKTLLYPKGFCKTTNAGIVQPVTLFLALYYAIFLFYFFYLKDVCTDATSDPNIVDMTCTTNSTALSKPKFQKKVEQYYKMFVVVAKILTFFLGFFVSTMMKRWWDQVKSLPDITQVALVLNGLVSNSRKEDSMHLKKTILRYCLLSYNAVMIQISKKAKKSKISSCCPDKQRVETNAIEDPEEKCLLLPEDADQFNTRNSRYWWVPINHACGLVQDSSQDMMIKDVKDVVAAIGKFQQSLQKLMQFHENPFPTLCVQVVHLACWMYVILGSFALQSCSGNHDAIWIPLLVNSNYSFVSFIKRIDNFRISLAFPYSTSSFCLLGSVWLRYVLRLLMGTAFMIWT